MMKTNWNSTWPVIYQSPAAKDGASCLRGDSTPFLFFFSPSGALNVSGWGQTEASQRETKRGGWRGNVYFSGRGAKIWVAVLSRQHRLRKRKWTVQRERNEEKRAVTRGSSLLLPSPSKVIDKIPDHNSFWPITTLGVGPVWPASNATSHADVR